jgi:phage tail sheath protein FI
MAQRLMTPGVYIEEVNAFPGSVVEVATAIPAFIGYTEKASRNGKTLINQPVRITSHAEYLLLFGSAFKPMFTLVDLANGSTAKHEITINGNAKAINYLTDNDSYMYRGIQLFFSNGGGTCYIVSVGTYEGKDKVEIKKSELEGGLNTLLKEQEPTMVVIPDVVKLAVDECYDVYKQVLSHCAKMQSRVAIFDIYDGYQARIQSTAPEDIIANFRELIGTEYLNYGAAYYPWLNTNIVTKGEIRFDNLDATVELNKLLPEVAAIVLTANFPTDKETLNTAIFRDKLGDLKIAIDKDKAEDEEYKKLKTDEIKLKEFINKSLNNLEDATLIETKKLVLEYLKSDESFKTAMIKEKQADIEKALLLDNKTEYDKAKAAANEVNEFFKNELEKLKDAEPESTNELILKYLKGDDTVKAAILKDNQPDLEALLKSDDNKDEFDAAKENENKLKEFIVKSFVDIENGNLKETSKLLANYISNKKRNYHQGLIATSPTYSNLLDEIRAVINLLPPSSAMAGIYTMVDNNRGVWKSPANISLNSVLKPSTNITHDEQENLNVDAVSGKSINAIRTFPGIGTLVWGGRTLDGNSLDWKYINVRRTMIMLEQSIKMALRSYVFEPNDANTWVSVKSMIVNYLTEKWKQGALAGASPDDAFEVQVGLGITMTGLDILEGKMLVSVKLAIVRPAEFIVVTFEQQMQKS